MRPPETTTGAGDPWLAEGARIEQLLDELERTTSRETWQRVETLVQRLTSLYGEGLGRLLAHARDAAGDLAARVDGDHLLAGLLGLHGLRPVPAAKLVRIEEPRRGSGARAHGPSPARGTRPGEAGRGEPAPSCELCAAPIPSGHDHVVDLEARALLCACRACALLFERPEAGRHRTVPRRVLRDDGETLTRERWAALGVPVNLAFLFFSSPVEGWTAVCPSPAGPTEAELPPGAADALRAESRLLRAIEPDVEALLVRGPRGAERLETFLAPIDVCYELVALVRRHWRGFDGGDEARRAIDDFFAALRARSRPLPDDAEGTR